ncbi:MAG: hypothetical protein CVU48_07240 [Candidatus Cloacimonetes bacterium HGW-Cloacimonetes-1]|jgi:hypothetical protein|nr:MAG: hypothetical protein CVU48_07240 [Candidatus Cloacimonetes bacterium HGW-Cloacimonetes-1]
MKHSIWVLIILLTVAVNLCALPTGKSSLFADSYMLRAHGPEAAYWNPALISPVYSEFLVPFANTSIYVANNSLNLRTYNSLMSDQYISDSDKRDLLDMIKGRLTVNSELHTSLFGFTNNNMSFSSAIHFYGNASISEKYIDLALNGNSEDEYFFNKGNNNAAEMSFIDLTMGMGNFVLPETYAQIPPINYGFSISLLTGITDTSTKSYSGYFSSTSDGMYANQDIQLKNSVGGIGFKSMLGFVAEPLPKLKAGMTIDNIFGFINWNLNTEQINYSIAVDSVYVSDLQDDFYTEYRSTEDIKSYTTAIPPELRLSTLYSFQTVNVSLDWVQGFGSSPMTSKIGRLALGTEYFPYPMLPLNFGLSLGNRDHPWRASYGIGFKSRITEFGIGLMSFKSLIPGYSSKGVSISTYMSVKL